MPTLQTVFETELKELLSKFETAKIPVSHQTDIIKDFTKSAIHDSAKDILEAMLNAAPDDLKTVRVERQKYSQEIQNQWETPLLYLELLILTARDFGIELNEESRYCTDNSHDHVFHALVRLQARACHTSLAILSLLKAGFADDAFARWRSVHEVAVTSKFIEQNNQQLAQKYLEHEIIQQYKLALAHSDVQKRINSDGVSEQELNSLKSCSDALVEKYGSEFKKNYGWAADALPHKQSSFSEIEKATQLDHLRPYYKMASDNIHANSHGVHFRVGLKHSEQRKLLVGASPTGLADPGHCTAISLMQTTLSLLSTQHTFDSVVKTIILTELSDRVGAAFLEVHAKHDPEMLATQ